jgi:GTP-binding protein YchF
MKIGLVGFPGSGKTTVFNALTGQTTETGYGAARGKTHLGVVKVPDPRVDALSTLFQPKKTTYAEIAFSDVAAGGAAASGGQASSLDTQTLTAMRDMDALCQVVRGFVDDAGAAPKMLDEVQSLEVEMNLADLILIEKRLERAKKEKGRTSEVALLERLKAQLDAGHPLRELTGVSDADWNLVSGFRFLSQKPLLLVLNVEESALAAPAPADVAEHARVHGLGLVVLSGKVEMDIAQMPAADQKEFIQALGLAESALGRFIRGAYSLLDLISFLTAGEDECRAWTIRRGTSAVHAAGKIHSDIERGFIRAETMRWDDLVRLGSEAKCREAAKLRLEGRDYVVQDGDVMNFRFNV